MPSVATPVNTRRTGAVERGDRDSGWHIRIMSHVIHRNGQTTGWWPASNKPPPTFEPMVRSRNTVYIVIVPHVYSNPSTCIYSIPAHVHTQTKKQSRPSRDMYTGQTHIGALHVCGGVGGIGKRLIPVKRSSADTQEDGKGEGDSKSRTREFY